MAKKKAQKVPAPALGKVTIEHDGSSRGDWLAPDVSARLWAELAGGVRLEDIVKKGLGRLAVEGRFNAARRAARAKARRVTGTAGKRLGVRGKDIRKKVKKVRGSSR